MLEIKNLTKIFDTAGGTQKISLDNLSLTVNDNDFITVIGSNGAGKSTLCNAIAGTIQCDAGSIILTTSEGKKVDILKLRSYKRAKYIGRVFQDPMMGTAATMQIEENLALAERRGKTHGLAQRITKAERNKYVEMLKQFDLGLETRLTTPVSALSGGQRQALTLIMAILANPQLLLLDEHTAALDPKTAKKVLDLTDKFVNDLKIPTIMITHNMQDAINYGNRLIMLHEGKIVFDVSGKEKEKLTVQELIKKFSEVAANQINDTMVLG